MDEEILTKARAFAESERRTFSAQLTIWVEEKLEALKVLAQEEVAP